MAEFNIETLELKSGVSRRNIRFYIQQGLLTPPTGERKAAKYNEEHLEQLLLIQKYKSQGLSLARISSQLSSEPVQPKYTGEVSVVTRIHIAAGITIDIDRHIAELTESEIKAFCERTVQELQALSKNKE